MNKPEHIKQLELVLSNDAARYLYLVSLISADRLVTKEACEGSLNVFNLINDNLHIMNLTDEIKTELLEFVKNGLEIVNREIKNFN